MEWKVLNCGSTESKVMSQHLSALAVCEVGFLKGSSYLAMVWHSMLFLDFVHDPTFYRKTTFQKLVLFSSSAAQDIFGYLGKVNLVLWTRVFIPSGPSEWKLCSIVPTWRLL
jgi:hypothetical protein